MTILCSIGFGTALTLISTRRKYKAETRLANAEIRLNEVETYSKMLDDFRRQLEFQANVLNNQALQIATLQEKEAQYLKIISQHQVNERQLKKRVSELENQIKNLQKQYNEQT